MEWFLSLHPFWQAVIRVLLILVPLLLYIPMAIWYERRLLSWMQDRIGPNRVGNITIPLRAKWAPKFLRGRILHMRGLLQPIADAGKLFFKEEVAPASVDRLIYLIAPGIALFPPFALLATIPWGPIRPLTPIADVNIGILYILAIASLGVYGVVLSGYASNNKYSLLGGLRSSAQLISYELGMGVSLAVIAMSVGSLKMTDMVRDQEGPLWGIFGPFANWHILTPYGFIAGIVFAVCMLAETNRPPFDLPEAENELVAGYHTEYSSFKFAAFFMGEYAAMGVYSAIWMVVFAGGWHLLPFNYDWLYAHTSFLSYLWDRLAGFEYWFAPAIFLFKVILGFTFFIWVRATLPRLRYDQLMSLGWKSLLPISVSNLIVVALWIVVTRVYGPLWGWVAVIPASVLAWWFFKSIEDVRSGDTPKPTLNTRTIQMVDPKLPETPVVNEVTV
ncbi:NADH-quinone oxidoreductase subunit NuoH [soil metagenome]